MKLILIYTIIIMDRYMRFFVGHNQEPHYVASGIAVFSTWTKKGAIEKFTSLVTDGNIKSRLPVFLGTPSHYVEGRIIVYNSEKEVPSTELWDLGSIRF